ncbi:MAG: lysophospholipid acyltransferase family protein [Pseudomonadota bacterium]
MWKIVGALRLGLSVVMVVIGLIACSFSSMMSRRVFFFLAHLWHRTLLWIIGIKPEYPENDIVEGSLLIGNHVSWADILVVGARWPVVFLAKKEIASWPVLGWIIRGAGTLFIERGKGASKALGEISETLKKGQTVLVFPEGRTSDGAGVLRFQPRLLQAAIDAGQVVQSFALMYSDSDGFRQERITYAGNVSFMGSFWRTVAGPSTNATVILSAVEHTGIDRQEIAVASEKWVQEQIESKFG